MLVAIAVMLVDFIGSISSGLITNCALDARGVRSSEGPTGRSRPSICRSSSQTRPPRTFVPRSKLTGSRSSNSGAVGARRRHPNSPTPPNAKGAPTAGAGAKNARCSVAAAGARVRGGGGRNKPTFCVGGLENRLPVSPEKSPE